MSLAPDLFRAHVGRRAANPFVPAEILFLQRQAEVGQVGLAGPVDQQVGRLDVPVDQPVPVGVVQRVGDRGDQPGNPDVVGIDPHARLARLSPSISFDTTKQKPSGVQPTS